MIERQYEFYQGIPYCKECPFLKAHPTELRAECDFLKEELSFYDWFIAQCAEQDIKEL